MPATASSQVLTSVRTVGGLLPADMLIRIAEGKDVSGSRPADYHVVGVRSVQDAAERHWDFLKGAWRALRDAIGDAGHDPSGLAVENWLLPLFEEHGFGRLERIPAGIQSTDRTATFPVTHRWRHVPVHLVGWDTDLDHRLPGGGLPPQSMLQECLNRSDEHLWGLSCPTAGSSGCCGTPRRWRAPRSSRSTWRRCSTGSCSTSSSCSTGSCTSPVSRSRTAPRRRPAGWRSGAPRRSRPGRVPWISSATAWRTRSPTSAPASSGIRRTTGSARTWTRICSSGRCCAWCTGCCSGSSPRTATCCCTRTRTRPRGPGTRSTTPRRGCAPPRCAASAPRTATCGGRSGSSSNALGDEDGLPRLGLAGLGGIYDDTGTDQILRGLELSNEHLLAAVKSLARVYDKSARRWRRVDYQNLGAEELGSIYESLLELVPKWSKEKREFLLDVMAGNERKSTGSYYTPTSLIDCLLDSTLDPVLDDAQKRAEVEATNAGTDPSARDRRRLAGGHRLRPGVRLRALPGRGRPAHRQAPGRGARAQPGTHRRGAAHRAAGRGEALHLRRRREPDGGRAGQGLALAGSAGTRQAARLPRRPHQVRQRADRGHPRADRPGHPRQGVQAHRGRRHSSGLRRLRRANANDRPDQDELFSDRFIFSQSNEDLATAAGPDRRCAGRLAARRAPPGRRVPRLGAIPGERAPPPGRRRLVRRVRLAQDQGRTPRHRQPGLPGAARAGHRRDPSGHRHGDRQAQGRVRLLPLAPGVPRHLPCPRRRRLQRWTPPPAGPAASPASSATRRGTRSTSRTRNTSARSSRPSPRSPGRQRRARIVAWEQENPDAGRPLPCRAAQGQGHVPVRQQLRRVPAVRQGADRSRASTRCRPTSCSPNGSRRSPRPPAVSAASSRPPSPPAPAASTCSATSPSAVPSPRCTTSRTASRSFPECTPATSSACSPWPARRCASPSRGSRSSCWTPPTSTTLAGCSRSARRRSPSSTRTPGRCRSSVLLVTPPLQLRYTKPKLDFWRFFI